MVFMDVCPNIQMENYGFWPTPHQGEAFPGESFWNPPDMLCQKIVPNKYPNQIRFRILESIRTKRVTTWATQRITRWLAVEPFQHLCGFHCYPSGCLMLFVLPSLLVLPCWNHQNEVLLYQVYHDHCQSASLTPRSFVYVYIHSLPISWISWIITTSITEHLFLQWRFCDVVWCCFKKCIAAMSFLWWLESPYVYIYNTLFEGTYRGRFGKLWLYIAII